jgi:hypothetical protein
VSVVRVSTLCLVAALVGACSDKQGPAFHLQAAGTAMAGSCAMPADASLNNVFGPVTVRLTFRARDQEGQPIGYCDAVSDTSHETPTLLAPRDGVRYDVFAEAFDNSSEHQRVAFGSLLDLDPSSVKSGNLRLYKAQVFRCVGGRLYTPRAFHSATLMPDGRVLFVGGVVVNASDRNVTTLPAPNNEVTATGAAELYDPRDQSLTPIAEDVAPDGRAFHSAFLVPNSTACPAGHWTVVLLGGLSPQTPGDPLLAASQGAAGGRMTPSAPLGMSAIPNQFKVQAAKSEYLCVDPIHMRGSRVMLSDTNLATYQGAAQRVDAQGQPLRAIVAGGIDYDGNMLNAVLPKNSLEVVDAAGGNTAAMTTVGRTGPSATFLDDTRVLVWGGGGVTDPLGDLVTGLDATPMVTSVTTMTPTAITQFHTATALDNSTSVLVTGGFEVNSGGVITQPPIVASAVRLVTVTGGAVSAQTVSLGAGFPNDPTCADLTNRYRPAGWESATKLPRGAVLITGGTPSTQATMTRCADCSGAASLFCPISQAAVYDPAVGIVLARNGTTDDGHLQVARFGHTSTRLRDDTILIAGGIGTDPSGDGTSAAVLGDLEIYNPRAANKPYYDANTGLDLDDPIYDDLMNDPAHPQRAAAMQATLSGQKEPAHPCDTL